MICVVRTRCYHLHFYYSLENFVSVLEPVLVEDINDEYVPKTYENIRKYFEAKNVYLDRNDTLVILLYICMLEMGFVPQGLEYLCESSSVEFNYNQILKLTNDFPVNWKKNDFWEFRFTLTPFPVHICHVSFVKVADDMLLNATVRSIEKCTACRLIDPSLYVIASLTNLHNVRFQNVKSLSVMFKSEIGYQMKTSILWEHNVRSAHILTLPDDILLQIAKNFNTLQTIGRFQRTCQRFLYVTEEEELWKKLIENEPKRKYYNHISFKALKREQRAVEKMAMLRRVTAAKQFNE